MNNSYHNVPAPACELYLRGYLKLYPPGCVVRNGIELPDFFMLRELAEQMVRYRSELAELRGRQQPVPASTKAEEV